MRPLRQGQSSGNDWNPQSKILKKIASLTIFSRTLVPLIVKRVRGVASSFAPGISRARGVAAEPDRTISRLERVPGVVVVASSQYYIPPRIHVACIALGRGFLSILESRRPIRRTFFRPSLRRKSVVRISRLPDSIGTTFPRWFHVAKLWWLPRRTITWPRIHPVQAQPVVQRVCFIEFSPSHPVYTVWLPGNLSLPPLPSSSSSPTTHPPRGNDITFSTDEHRPSVAGAAATETARWNEKKIKRGIAGRPVGHWLQLSLVSLLAANSSWKFVA